MRTSEVSHQALVNICKSSTMADPETPPDPLPAAEPAAATGPHSSDAASSQAERDLADVPAVEVVVTVAVHLMSAAAVKCGLGESGSDDDLDLAEARILINALAGLVSAAAPDMGSVHARPLRDGLKSLQAAFREASPVPDPPGQGPGEHLR